VVRVALLGPDGPTGTFTRWENETIPWRLAQSGFGSDNANYSLVLANGVDRTTYSPNSGERIGQGSGMTPRRSCLRARIRTGTCVKYFHRRPQWCDQRRTKEPGRISLRLFVFQAVYFAHFARLATHLSAKSRRSWP
jgi:hypothetical protein